VIADACYSGDIIIRGTHDMFEGIGGKGRILIGYEGAARENAKLGYGYLTHYFIEALEGAGDANRDGKITLLEAYEYAAEKIRKLTGTGLWIKGEGDLDLITGIKH
jgi:hypothetical protein